MSIFVCGHRPKTKELFELLLFTIWFISSLKEIEVEEILPNRDSNRGPSAPQPSNLSLSYSHIITLNVKIDFNISPQTLDQYWSTLVIIPIPLQHEKKIFCWHWDLNPRPSNSSLLASTLPFLRGFASLQLINSPLLVATSQCT